MASSDLDLLLRSGSLPLTWLRTDGTIWKINEVSARNLGSTPAELEGTRLGDLLPEVADRIQERIDGIVATREEIRFEDEVTLPDGNRRVFESWQAPVFDDSGSVVGVLAISTDVTERRDTEARLAAAERRYHQAMEVVHDGVWDWNVATGDFEMSPNFFALVGYTEAELDEGRTEWFFSVLHPDDRARVQHLIEAHFAGETPEYAAEYRWKHKDGTWRWALARGRVVERSEEGAPVRMLGTTIDVTDRHTLEARLLAAEKMEAIGRLAGGVAHDFNNLLTAILGHVEFLSDNDLPPEAQQDIVQIRAATQRASQLTTQLLSFARRRMVRPRPVRVHPLLDGLQGLLSGMVGATVHIELELADGLPDVFIDPTQLEQILVNLVLNARDAMPDGGVVTLSTSVVTLDADKVHTELVGGQYVELAVSDTGTGMDAATVDRIFEPFFSTKPVGEGTGLGLASSYGIVRQAGGQLTVHSQPGEGSTFLVHLPAVDADAQGHAASTRTVLVVEDDDMVRRTAVRALELSGYRVLQAASGDQALAMEPSFGAVIDLLVTDVVMPGMTGRTLAERLRARQPALEVLFVSGYAHDHSSGRGLLEEGVNFLPKPFTPSTLVSRVRALLGQD